MALDDLHTWRIGQDGNCKEFDAAVHSHVDNLLSKHSILEPDEKNVKDLFRSLNGAHDGYQNAWKHAQAHGLDDPAVSPVEAAATKEGWKLSVANLHAERNKVVRVLKAIWRARAGEGRFDFGFCVCGERPGGRSTVVPVGRAKLSTGGVTTIEPVGRAGPSTGGVTIFVVKCGEPGHQQEVLRLFMPMGRAGPSTGGVATFVPVGRAGLSTGGPRFRTTTQAPMTSRLSPSQLLQ